MTHMLKLKLVIILLSFNSLGIATAATLWGYSGDGAPENWASLSADYAACSGLNQSPINMEGFIEAELSPIEFNYGSDARDVENNGHTIQVNYQPGSSITIDKVNFDLVQFHFHAPSENSIHGKTFPVEAHFVHSSQDGQLAVIALMFESGENNDSLMSVWQSMPSNSGITQKLTGSVSADKLLPKNRDYYRFNGSLTTPPCTEGVRWLVMKEAAQASPTQIEALKTTLKEDNNRPIQPVNARVILQ